jgi:hypothetical protein
VFGAIAITKKSSADAVCSNGVCTDRQGVDTMREASKAGNLSTVFVSAGLGAAVCGAVLLIWPSSPLPTSEKTSTSLSVDPMVGSHAVGVSIQGKWL